MAAEEFQPLVASDLASLGHLPEFEAHITDVPSLLPIFDTWVKERFGDLAEFEDNVVTRHTGTFCVCVCVCVCLCACVWCVWYVCLSKHVRLIVYPRTTEQPGS